MVRVHFATVLALPSDDRPRRAGLVYPKVAQSRGSPDRLSSKDLRWGWNTLSSPSAAARQSLTTARFSPKSSLIIRNKSSRTVVVVESFSDVALTLDFTDPKWTPTAADMLFKCQGVTVTPIHARSPHDSKIAPPFLCTHTSPESSADSKSSHDRSRS